MDKKKRNESRKMHRILKRKVEKQWRHYKNYTKNISVSKLPDDHSESPCSTSSFSNIPLRTHPAEYSSDDNYDEVMKICLDDINPSSSETDSVDSFGSLLSEKSLCGSECSCTDCDVLLGSQNEVDSEAEESCDDAVEPSWKEKIQHWAVRHQVTHGALGDLLKLLQPSFPELPVHPKTILKTGKKVAVEPMGEGAYYNFGLKKMLINRVSTLNLSPGSTIYLSFNIDSVPLFKSTGVGFTPILALICGSNLPPFVCAIYCGPGKPVIDMLLKDFVPDLDDLMDNGIEIEGRVFNVEVKAFVCDAPARAYAKCVNGHSGYSSCERCDEEGTRRDSRMLFLEMGGQLRTDESFATYADPCHHRGVSPLTDIGILMVSKFVLDYMHLVCLGVMRKLLMYWRSHKRKLKFSSKFINIINRLLILCAEFWPSDFNRKPRGLEEIKRWKATELRQFLLYLGPVVLKNYFQKYVYEHFLLLHAAIIIFTRKDLCHVYRSKAEAFLKEFVRKGQCPELYGQKFLIFNVHCLLHLGDDVKMYVALDNVSAFVFENELHTIKHMIRGSTRPLQQLVNRLSEKEILPQSPSENEEGLVRTSKWHGGPTAGLHGGSHYSKYFLNKRCLSLKKGDNVIMLNDSTIILAINFYENSEGVWVIGKKFVQYSDLYMYPIESSKLGIFMAESLSDFPRKYPVRKMKAKCLSVPLERNGAFAIYSLIN